MLLLTYIKLSFMILPGYKQQKGQITDIKQVTAASFKKIHTMNKNKA